jgi:hypothetical protein
MTYLRNLLIRTLSHNCIYIHDSCITSCVYIERYLLIELLNSPSHYLSFQAYSLLASHFVGPSEPALLLKLIFFFFMSS